MAEKDSRAMLYVGLGALAAVGAGYLAWRFVLSDEQKARAKEGVRTALSMGREAATNAVHEISAVGHEAATNGAQAVRTARRAITK